MTDLEFDVLDELYFVISFDSLQKVTNLKESELRSVLGSFLKNDWVKCFSDVSTELSDDEIHFERDYANYHYLASKVGLKAHNTQ